MTFPQEGAEKQAQLERSLREKAAVEKELEKVRKTTRLLATPCVVRSSSSSLFLSLLCVISLPYKTRRRDQTNACKLVHKNGHIGSRLFYSYEGPTLEKSAKITHTHIIQLSVDQI